MASGSSDVVDFSHFRKAENSSDRPSAGKAVEEDGPAVDVEFDDEKR